MTVYFHSQTLDISPRSVTPSKNLGLCPRSLKKNPGLYLIPLQSGSLT